MKYFKRLLMGVFLFFIGITSVYALDVGINSVTITEQSDDIEVAAPTVSENSIDATITFHKLNDYVTFEVDLDTDKTISSVTDDNESDYIKSTYTYEGSKFYLTLKYDTDLDGALDLENMEIKVNFEDGSSTIINPNTSDHIYKYLLILLLSLFGFLFGLTKLKKQFRVATIAAVLLLPTVVFAADALSSTFTLNVEHIAVEPIITVTYDADGGTPSFASKEIAKGESIGAFPTIEKENYTLVNWYKESTFDTVADTSYVPTQDVTIFARMIKSVNGSTVSPTELELTVGDTETITVSNVEEEYSFSSSASGVASVNGDGEVTGVSAGEATITITGETSGEIKTVSVTVTASSSSSPVDYINRQEAGVISIGDEIAIGDEHFYVVSTNASKTAVLAKYNLYVGDIMASDFSSHETILPTDAKYGIQDPTAIGVKTGLSEYVGTVAFSGAKYWTSSEYANVYKSSMSDTAPEYEYVSTGGNAQDNGYTIAFYVEQYVTGLKEAGAPDTITGRLLLSSEATALGCVEEGPCATAYPWIYSSSYWTGYVSEDVGTNLVGFINTNRMFEFNLFKKNNQYGVRPVIVFDTSDLSE